MMRMYRTIVISVFLVMILAGVNTVHADNYTKTIEMFKKSDAVKPFFKSAHGYAVFPMVGTGGLMYEASIGGQKFSFEPVQ